MSSIEDVNYKTLNMKAGDSLIFDAKAEGTLQFRAFPEGIYDVTLTNVFSQRDHLRRELTMCEQRNEELQHELEQYHNHWLIKKFNWFGYRR